MSVWHLIHRKSAFSHFNLLFPLFSQLFAFCLPLSLKLSLKPELQFLVESLQLHETFRTREPFTSLRSKLQHSSVWTAHVRRDSCWSPLGRRSALQVGAVELHTAQGRTGTRQWANAFLGSVTPWDAAFLGIKCTLRLEVEKLCNILALCISLFSLQHLHLLLLSEPGALHKGDCYHFFPSHTGLLLISARKGLFWSQETWDWM